MAPVSQLDLVDECVSAAGNSLEAEECLLPKEATKNKLNEEFHLSGNPWGLPVHAQTSSTRCHADATQPLRAALRSTNGLRVWLRDCLDEAGLSAAAAEECKVAYSAVPA